jgi:signal transduction protein with GAF and PtsI domain
MQPNCIAPVKSLLRNIKLMKIKQIVDYALDANYETVRSHVIEYLEDIKYVQNV